MNNLVVDCRNQQKFTKSCGFLLEIIGNCRFIKIWSNFVVDVEIYNYFVVECRKMSKCVVDSTFSQTPSTHNPFFVSFLHHLLFKFQSRFPSDIVDWLRISDVNIGLDFFYLASFNFQTASKKRPSQMRLTNPDQQLSNYVDLETQQLNIKIGCSHFFR